MKLIFSILCVSCLFFCTPAKKEGLLSWVILNEELHISHIREKGIEPCAYNCAEIRFKLVNTSDQNILLYNFSSSFELGEFEEGVYCDSSAYRSAERLICIYKANDEQVVPIVSTPPLYWDPKSVPDESVPSKLRFRKSRQIVKKGEEVEFSQNVNLKQFNLTNPGIYSLKLLYYQHNVLTEINQEELERDLVKDDAYLFKGCLWSNPVKLIVE